MSGPEPSLVILDYGMGNRRSVEKACEKVGARTTVSADEKAIREADGIILPGVGAFPRAMSRIHELGLDEMLRNFVELCARAEERRLGKERLSRSRSGWVPYH